MLRVQLNLGCEFCHLALQTYIPLLTQIRLDAKKLKEQLQVITHFWAKIASLGRLRSNPLLFVQVSRKSTKPWLTPQLNSHGYHISFVILVFLYMILQRCSGTISVLYIWQLIQCFILEPNMLNWIITLCERFPKERWSLVMSLPACSLLMCSPNRCLVHLLSHYGQNLDSACPRQVWGGENVTE